LARSSLSGPQLVAFFSPFQTGQIKSFVCVRITFQRLFECGLKSGAGVGGCLCSGHVLCVVRVFPFKFPFGSGQNFSILFRFLFFFLYLFIPVLCFCLDKGKECRKAYQLDRLYFNCEHSSVNHMKTHRQVQRPAQVANRKSLPLSRPRVLFLNAPQRKEIWELRTYLKIIFTILITMHGYTTCYLKEWPHCLSNVSSV